MSSQIESATAPKRSDGERLHGAEGARHGSSSPRSARVVGRAVAVAVCASAYYAFDWKPAVVALRDSVAYILGLLGVVAELSYRPDGWPQIVVGERVNWYSRECLYLDLILILAPLVWNPRARAPRNWRNVAIFAGVVSALNLIRCVISAYGNARGIDVVYRHDVPDHALYTLIVILTCLFALRRSRRESGSTLNSSRILRFASR